MCFRTLISEKESTQPSPVPSPGPSPSLPPHPRLLLFLPRALQPNAPTTPARHRWRPIAGRQVAHPGSVGGGAGVLHGLHGDRHDRKRRSHNQPKKGGKREGERGKGKGERSWGWRWLKSVPDCTILFRTVRYGTVRGSFGYSDVLFSESWLECWRDFYRIRREGEGRGDVIRHLSPPPHPPSITSFCPHSFLSHFQLFYRSTVLRRGMFQVG